MQCMLCGMDSSSPEDMIGERGGSTGTEPAIRLCETRALHPPYYPVEGFATRSLHAMFSAMFGDGRQGCRVGVEEPP